MLRRPRAESQTATLDATRPAVVPVLFLGVCLVVAYATLLPFRFTLQRVLEGSRGFPWIGLQTHSPTPLSDLVGNVILFLPVGALAWLGLRGGRGGLHAWVAATLAGAGLSFAIEVLQCFTPTRTPAVSDLIANTVGSVLGAGATMLAWPRFRRLPRMDALVVASRREPPLMVLAALVVLLCVQACLPFDYSLHPQVLQRALLRAQLVPWLDPGPWFDAGSMLLFALLGAVTLRVAQLLEVRSASKRILFSVGFVAALALGLEAAQILFRSQVMASKDVLGRLGGAGLGMMGVSLLSRRLGARSWSAATALYAVALLLVNAGRLGASGYEVMQARLRALVPLYATHFRATLADVSQFTEACILFVPLGFLLARECGERRLRSPWNTLLVTVLCVMWAALARALRPSPVRELTQVSWMVAAGLGAGIGSATWLWFEALRLERAGPAADTVAGKRSIA